MNWKKIAEKIVAIIQEWESTEAIAEYTQGTNIYDTGFCIDIIVYCTKLPFKIQRRRSFHFVNLYEYLATSNQDRLLLEGIPLRIRYELIRKTERLCKNPSQAQKTLNCLQKFWWITVPRIAYSRSGRLEQVQQCIQDLPQGFWNKHKRALAVSLQDRVRNLRLAEQFNNAYLFSCSVTDFARVFVSLLFCLEHKFEPPEGVVMDALDKHVHIPATVLNRLKIFVFDTDLSFLQRSAIAELILQDTAY